MTKQPASISILMEIRDVWARPGTICAFLDSWESLGLSISHSCVDSSFPPSGWLILIGFLVFLMLIAGQILLTPALLT